MILNIYLVKKSWLACAFAIVKDFWLACVLANVVG